MFSGAETATNGGEVFDDNDTMLITESGSIVVSGAGENAVDGVNWDSLVNRGLIQSDQSVGVFRLGAVDDGPFSISNFGEIVTPGGIGILVSSDPTIVDPFNVENHGTILAVSDVSAYRTDLGV